VSTLHIRHLNLVDFRTYDELDLDLPGGPIAFVGPNGMGKTNIIEAIRYLSTLDSHRVASDTPLIRQGASSARIAAEVVRDDRALKVEIEIIPGSSNRARINNSSVQRTREIIGIIRTVMFAPEDLAIVKGDPSDRRRMVDDVVVQRQPRLAGVRADYERVIKQRNALLKSAQGARRVNSEAVDATLSVWDEQLIEFGAPIMVARNNTIRDLQPLAAAEYARIAPDSPRLAMAYHTTLGTEPITDVESTASRLREMITQRRKDELDRGVTLIGPHRDDVHLSIGDLPVKGYASHGESWSVVLALRLGSYDLFDSEEATPLLILDDVFAELDATRRRHLAQRVASAAQVFITAAVADDVPEQVAATWFDVSRPQVSQPDVDYATAGGRVMRRD
jgi:DNA replication and repair protein RecF